MVKGESLFCLVWGKTRHFITSLCSSFFSKKEKNLSQDDDHLKNYGLNSRHLWYIVICLLLFPLFQKTEIYYYIYIN